MDPHQHPYPGIHVGLVKDQSEVVNMEAEKLVSLASTTIEKLMPVIEFVERGRRC